jgi:monoamine oxidase
MTLRAKFLTWQPYTVKTPFLSDKPFWRDQGYSGTGVTSSGVVFVDKSPADGSLDILLAFPDRRRKDLTYVQLIGYATSLFGRSAKSRLDIVEQDWRTEPWLRVLVILRLVFLPKHGSTRLRPPIGRLHWAGAENPPVWPSLMEGAVYRVYD